MIEQCSKCGKQTDCRIQRLEAINAELLAACKDADRMYSELSEHALAGRPAMVPAMIVMRLNAAIANAQPTD